MYIFRFNFKKPGLIFFAYIQVFFLEEAERLNVLKRFNPNEFRALSHVKKNSILGEDGSRIFKKCDLLLML